MLALKATAAGELVCWAAVAAVVDARLLRHLLGSSGGGCGGPVSSVVRRLPKSSAVQGTTASIAKEKVQHTAFSGSCFLTGSVHICNLCVRLRIT